MRHENFGGGGGPEWDDAYRRLVDLQEKVDHRIKVLLMISGFNTSLVAAQMALAIVIAVMTLSKLISIWWVH
jgi:hypothetical protein